MPKKPHASGDTMWVGQSLRRQSLTSESGEFVLVHQDDGNLVLYAGDEATWSSCTHGTSAGRCVLQDDGNLVVYDAEGVAQWASGTNGRPVRRLVVQDDGDVVLHDTDGGERWSTATAGDRMPAANPDLPRSVDAWRAYLASYSADYLRVADEDALDVSEEQRTAVWLGYDGASEADVTALEERLGKRLPPSYRTFLLTSDGWSNPGPFMYDLRTTKTVGWMSDADPDFATLFQDDDDDWYPAPSRSLLISGDGDAQYWFLDPEEISDDGEWAAHTWSSWSPEGEKFPTFADLLADERDSFESLSGRDGRGVHPEGVDALLTTARRQAAEGDVDAALASLSDATRKGSGLAAYLRTILRTFIAPDGAHHTMRNDAFAGPVSRGEIDLTHVQAELVPLFLRWSAEDTGITSWHLDIIGNALPTTDNTDWETRLATFVPPVLPEPPAFQAALDQARALSTAGDNDTAWRVIEHALPEWHSDSPYRIAPTILLTDPTLRHTVTPDRYHRIVTTPRHTT